MKQPPEAPDSRRWLVLAITASGLFLICVDLTVLYVALPALTQDLAATNSQRLWILNAYPIVVAGLLPGLGTLGDRYGHRLLFMAGLATFGLASLGAAFAPAAMPLIAARAGLGAGAAMMMPATLAIIRASFVDPGERATAIGLWAGIASGGMALGPIIAGLLLAKFHWGSVFLINVPVVAVALALTPWLIGRRSAPGGPPWDLAGSVQLLILLTALVYAIKEPARQDFSILRLGIALCLFGGALALYVHGQKSKQHPLLDFTLFRSADFRSAFAAACLGTAGWVGVEFALTQHLQLVEERTPLGAAIVLLPAAVAGFAAGPLAGRMLRSMNAAHLGAGALVVAAISCAALAWLPQHLDAPDLPRMLMITSIGLGIGASVTYASSQIMNAAPPDRAGMAASIEEVGFELGNALGVAVFGAVMTLAYAASLPVETSSTLLPASARDSLDEALRAASAMNTADGAALQLAGRAAFTDALRVTLSGVSLLWLATGAAIAATAARDRR